MSAEQRPMNRGARGWEAPRLVPSAEEIARAFDEMARPNGYVDMAVLAFIQANGIRDARQPVDSSILDLTLVNGVWMTPEDKRKVRT